MAIAGAVVILAAVDGVAHGLSGSPLWPSARSPDDVGESDKRLRQQAFNAMGPLTLASVSDAERKKAIDSMRLPPEQQRILAPVPSAPTLGEPRSRRNQKPVARSDRIEPPRLAWLTLWDTDVEDGDIVKIDSGGYSRVITLTKAPITFAIPAPADGVVNVTGVSDGDGGGVTVGLASGASTAVFPVMSVGQVLGLRVRLQP